MDELKLVSIGTVRNRGIPVESRCAVCEIGINDANVPENCFACNFCSDFYMCETCFKRQPHPGGESSGKICPADTMLVARLRDSRPGMNECSICSIEFEDRYSR